MANQLANSGADAAAAQLLPTLFPDRMQAGGSFLYAAVAVEAGECDGKKSAILHFANITEAGKRWAIAPARPAITSSRRATRSAFFMSDGSCAHASSPSSSQSGAQC